MQCGLARCIFDSVLECVSLNGSLHTEKKVEAKVKSVTVRKPRDSFPGPGEQRAGSG